MRSLEELKTRLEDYGEAEVLYYPDVGYIAWHYGTGENIEMLFVEVAERGRGRGRWLYREMVSQVRSSPRRRPYHSVYAFRLTTNHDAERFYLKMGWTQKDLGRCIYGGGDTTLMWITWENLLENLREERDENDT